MQQDIFTRCVVGTNDPSGTSLDRLALFKDVTLDFLIALLVCATIIILARIITGKILKSKAIDADVSMAEIGREKEIAKLKYDAKVKVAEAEAQEEQE